jgi:hypothetical protein
MDKKKEAALHEKSSEDKLKAEAHYVVDQFLEKYSRNNPKIKEDGQDIQVNNFSITKENYFLLISCNASPIGSVTKFDDVFYEAIYG